VAAVVHGACSSGSNTISHVSLGKAASSTGEVIVAGAVTASLAVSAGHHAPIRNQRNFGHDLVKTLEYRKIIQVGYRFAQPDSPPVLDAKGLPSTPVEQEYVASIVFWIPAKQPFQRSEGKTVVFDPRPFELEALRDGALLEHAQDFTFPRQPPSTRWRAA
jgi:hypothetical protein